MKFVRRARPDGADPARRGDGAPSTTAQYDVLLSTTIVESGLDIPTANTLIVHRADMFGLSQLYQLRGRVGRAKARAYAYLTTPLETSRSPPAAEKRLKVLQSLDSLGAGFQLASHDLDISWRGELAGRRAVRPYQGDRRRALPADVGRRRSRAEGYAAKRLKIKGIGRRRSTPAPLS